MIALDTNVLVRFLNQDDDAQFQVAADLIEGCTRDLPGYLREAQSRRDRALLEYMKYV